MGNTPLTPLVTNWQVNSILTLRQSINMLLHPILFRQPRVIGPVLETISWPSNRDYHFNFKVPTWDCLTTWAIANLWT